MYCPICQRTGKDGQFCSDCGTELVESKVPCPHSICDGMNDRGSKFCDECGKPIQENGKLKEGGGE